MKKFVAIICCLCICFSLSITGYANGTVCPRCSAPTVIEVNKDFIKGESISCQNISEKQDQTYRVEDVTLTVCAAGCGFSMEAGRKDKGGFIPCTHIGRLQNKNVSIDDLRQELERCEQSLASSKPSLNEQITEQQKSFAEAEAKKITEQQKDITVHKENIAEQQKKLDKIKLELESFNFNEE